MRKITAYGKRDRVNRSLSNYIDYSGIGYEGAKRKLVETINAQPFDGEKIAKALNRIEPRLYTFKAGRKQKGKIIIEAADLCGNTDCISIEEI